MYHLYQDQLHFSPTVLTLIFGLYALSLRVALLTVGSLSDHLGRKPVIFTAALINSVVSLIGMALGALLTGAPARRAYCKAAGRP